jgi:hypothetical protein
VLERPGAVLTETESVKTGTIRYFFPYKVAEAWKSISSEIKIVIKIKDKR